MRRSARSLGSTGGAGSQLDALDQLLSSALHDAPLTPAKGAPPPLPHGRDGNSYHNATGSMQPTNSGGSQGVSPRFKRQVHWGSAPALQVCT